MKWLPRAWLRRRADKVLAVLIGVALGVGFLISERPHPRDPGGSRAEASAGRMVGIAIAEKIGIPIVADAVGTVRSRRQTEIASRILGEIDVVHVRPGDDVDAGDLLISLDRRELETRVAESEATLRALEQRLADAETAFERTRNLFEKDATTQQILDAVTFRLAEVVAQRDAAVHGLELARIQLGYATIRAPFAGTIWQRVVDPGDIAAPGRALLGLFDPAELRLDALVDEKHLSILAIGERVAVRLDALGREVPGVVSEVVPAVDPLTRTGVVKLDVPPDLGIRPGMFGRARVVVGEREAVVVPTEAVVERGQLELVFALDGAPGESAVAARMTLVRVGETLAGATEGSTRAEVLSGLEPGTHVVTTGSVALRDGDLVRAAAVSGAGGAR